MDIKNGTYKEQNHKLNIGAAKSYIPNMINIDISGNADISLDLSEDVLPFKDSSADLVFTYHTLEHINNYLHALSEIHRVLNHGGVLLIGVPYVSSTRYNLVNPYHHHNFNEYSFDFFDSDKLKGSAAEENPVMFKKIFHRFHYMGPYKFAPGFLKSISRRHFFNVISKIDFGLVCQKELDQPLILPSKKNLISLFDQCLQDRVKHS